MSAADRKSVRIWSEGTRLAAEFWTPKEAVEGELLATILLLHGWGGLKEHLNATYAPKFAAAGFAVLAFDYRGWGESEGRLVLPEPQPSPDEQGEVLVRARVIREVVDPFDQILDVVSALDWLCGEPVVDTERIGVWGSSYGGGHAVVIAALDERIKALVAQVSGQDSAQFEEARAQARGRAIAKARGDIDPIPQGIDQVPGLAGTPDFAKMIRYRPVKLADRIRVPTLIIDARDEELMDRRQHGQAVYEIVRQNAPARYEVFPCKHYEIYDQYYPQASDCALEWFEEHLVRGS
jgi:dipeptidyl aminopeptidase/acylaminoacyl peptidase